MAEDIDLKVGVSGVRGVVGHGLTAQVAGAFAGAFAQRCPGNTVALGRDTRVSGPMLRSAVLAALVRAGKRVVDMGILPVPSMQTAIRLTDDLAGGVYISASHNPADQNGLKFYRPDGIILYPQQAEALISSWRQGDVPAVEVPGSLETYDGAITRHIERVASLVDCDLIKEAKLSVVMDCNNGAGCLCSRQFLVRLGVARVAMLNEDPTGDFAHKPEPVPEHMEQLARAVGRLGYHIGFAQDPDADRVAVSGCVQRGDAVVGEAFSDEYTLGLGAASVAAQARERGHVISMACNLSTSRMIEEVAHDHKFPFRRTPVGEVNVVEGLQALERQWRAEHPADDDHFCFGGEGCGGIIDPRNQYCRDSLNSMGLIIQGLAQWKLGRIFADSPRPDDERLLLDWWRKAALRPCAIVKKKLELDSVDDQSRVMQAMREQLPAAVPAPENVRTDDGMRVKYRDRSWIHVRCSNTEPAIRFIAEHDSVEQSGVMVDEAMSLAQHALSKG